MEVAFPKKVSFTPNGQFWPNCGPKVIKTCITGSAQIFFFILCIMIGHNKLRIHWSEIGPQLGQNFPIGPKEDTRGNFTLNNFSLLVVPYHAVKFEIRP